LFSLKDSQNHATINNSNMRRRLRSQQHRADHTPTNREAVAEAAASKQRRSHLKPSRRDDEGVVRYLINKSNGEQHDHHRSRHLGKAAGQQRRHPPPSNQKLVRELLHFVNQEKHR